MFNVFGLLVDWNDQDVDLKWSSASPCQYLTNCDGKFWYHVTPINISKFVSPLPGVRTELKNKFWNGGRIVKQEAHWSSWSPSLKSLYLDTPRCCSWWSLEAPGTGSRFRVRSRYQTHLSFMVDRSNQQGKRESNIQYSDVSYYDHLDASFKPYLPYYLMKFGWLFGL